MVFHFVMSDGSEYVIQWTWVISLMCTGNHILVLSQFRQLLLDLSLGETDLSTFRRVRKMTKHDVLERLFAEGECRRLRLVLNTVATEVVIIPFGVTRIVSSFFI